MHDSKGQPGAEIRSGLAYPHVASWLDDVMGGDRSREAPLG